MPIKIFFIYENDIIDTLESTTDIITYMLSIVPGSKQLQILNNKPESPILEPYVSRGNPIKVQIEINGVMVYSSGNLRVNTIIYYNEFNVVLQQLREYIDITFYID